MSKYETQAGIPTRGLCYAKLIEHIRESQDCCAMMAHLHNTEGNDMDKLLAKGWLGMEELMKRMTYQITELAKKSMS